MGFKSICNSTNFIKLNLKILSTNPDVLDLMNDPCIMDLPIAYKPTFSNMDLDFEDIHFKDDLEDNAFQFNSLKILFGENLDVKWIESIKINSSAENYWA